MSEPVTLDPQWAGRRRIIYATLIFSWASIFYASAKDAPTAAAVVPPMALIITGVVSAYVFGGAWERIGGVPSGNVVTTTTSVTPTPPAPTTSTTTKIVPSEGAPAP
jgi:hypothetical protein